MEKFNVITCPSCGSTNDTSNNNCLSCGTKLDHQQFDYQISFHLIPD